MAARVKSKPLQKRSPASAAFDRFTNGTLVTISSIVVLVVISQSPQTTMHQLATGLSAWIHGNP